MPQNVLFSGSKSAFDEDNWTHVRIGSTIFRVCALCPRCSLPTIDPDTTVRNKAMEPSKTLKTFRRSANFVERKIFQDSPFFGIHLGLDEGFDGVVKVNDKVHAVRWRENVAEPTSSIPWYIFGALAVAAIGLSIYCHKTK